MVKQVTIFVLSINIYLHVNLIVIKLYIHVVRSGDFGSNKFHNEI